jgi:hypothetical protein
MAELLLNLSKKLNKNIEKNANFLNLTKERYLRQLLEDNVIDTVQFKPKNVEENLPVLIDLLNKIPTIKVISSDIGVYSKWWIKFDIDINHKLAWHVVQALGFVLNYISLTELLPTIFKPVSPPPYLNGGPDGCLSWVIESQIPFLDPGYIATVIAERLPNPINDEQQWLQEDFEDDINTENDNRKVNFLEKISKFFRSIVRKE